MRHLTALDRQEITLCGLPVVSVQKHVPMDDARWEQTRCGVCSAMALSRRDCVNWIVFEENVGSPVSELEFAGRDDGWGGGSC